MEEEKGLIDINDVQGIIKFLQDPTKVAEVLTGIFVSDRSELKLSAGKLVQASIKHKFFTQLGKEIREYQEKGKIKEDYFATHKEQATLLELLKFIDEEVPDEERFKAMKSIFLFTVSNDASQDDKELAYESIKICKRITGGGLLVLKACYDIVNGNIRFDCTGRKIVLGTTSAGEWFTVVAKQIGHNINSLVELHEDELANLKLISPRMHPDGSGIKGTKYFRLTELGFKLCDFITKFP